MSGPRPFAWMTRESKARLRNGGNCKGAVPIHLKRSPTATIPVYVSPVDDPVIATLVAEVRHYTSSYLLDENADPSLCFDGQHHAAVRRLFRALEAATGAQS